MLSILQPSSRADFLEVARCSKADETCVQAVSKVCACVYLACCLQHASEMANLASPCVTYCNVEVGQNSLSLGFGWAVLAMASLHAQARDPCVPGT